MNNWVIVAVVLGAALLATALVIAMVGGLCGPPPGGAASQRAGGVRAGQPLRPCRADLRWGKVFDPCLLRPASGRGVRREGRADGGHRLSLPEPKEGRGGGAGAPRLDRASAEEIKVDGQTGFSYAAVGAGAAASAGLIWQEGPVIYQVFVTAPDEGESDLEALKRAALGAAQAVLRLWKKG
jgi:hypothetical protein